MKNKLLYLFCFLLISFNLKAQETSRIENIKNNLEVLSLENTGLTEQLKLNINVTNVTLSNLLLAVSTVHKINITVDPSLQNITLVNNFSNVNVSDLLIFLCKKYDLNISFTGNILAIEKYSPPVVPPMEKEIIVQYDPMNNLISMDLNNDPLHKVFRKIIDLSGQNILFSNSLENKSLNLYITNVPIEVALEKLAETNDLIYSKSKDGFYLFDTPFDSNGTYENGKGNQRKNRLNSDLNYRIIDTLNQILEVDFNNTPIERIINNLSTDLNLDFYTATPLSEAGTVNFKARSINYDNLLLRIFESLQNTIPLSSLDQGSFNSSPRVTNQTPTRDKPNNQYTFKKEDNIYFFGTTDQLSVRKVEVVPLMHRSIELLGDPTSYTGSSRAAGRTNSGSVNYLGGSDSQGGFQSNQNFGNQNSNNNSRNINTQQNTFGSYSNDVEALVNILPDEVINHLDIKIDYELNSFLVSGPATNINRFKDFISKIDKPVPVILIEVMIIEVKKSSTIETGISWGIGDEPAQTKGAIFPETNLTLGASTINKVIGGFDGFGSFNIGKVVPDFFATIKAMEQNGNIKIRSTPKLSTLNGHRAKLSIGETTYYVVTNQNFFGSQIPTSSEVRNYQPIDAELAISIKPLVSGNGQVTLDINVLQSDFSSERIEADAPPGLTSREFSSIIRMQNQDMVILGGLEEKVKNDSGTGVPFLARIPIIKWLFSSRKREDSKRKLTILIKPTVIY